MAVNQSQVDHILSSASADDPEVKMQNLQDEVDLLKKSVKKLLIDLRERMNHLRRPLQLSLCLKKQLKLKNHQFLNRLLLKSLRRYRKS